jgi:hypothetical protein
VTKAVGRYLAPPRVLPCPSGRPSAGQQGRARPERAVISPILQLVLPFGPNPGCPGRIRPVHRPGSPEQPERDRLLLGAGWLSGRRRSSDRTELPALSRDRAVGRFRRARRSGQPWRVQTSLAARAEQPPGEPRRPAPAWAEREQQRPQRLQQPDGDDSTRIALATGRMFRADFACH